MLLPCWSNQWMCITTLQFGLFTESPGRPFILEAIEEAKQIVDEAYKYSREE